MLPACPRHDNELQIVKEEHSLCINKLANNQCNMQLSHDRISINQEIMKIFVGYPVSISEIDVLRTGGGNTPSE